jgi:hypothetical protein
MRTLTTLTRPGTSRVLDALGKLASELKTEKSKPTPATDWRSSLIEGQRNVIRHYRRVLATQRMSPGERQALLDRIAHVEGEIRALEIGEKESRQLEAA